MLTDWMLAQVPKSSKDTCGCFLGPELQQVQQVEQASDQAKAQAKHSFMT